jgi:hypothetical protein
VRTSCRCPYKADDLMLMCSERTHERKNVDGMVDNKVLRRISKCKGNETRK